MNMRIFILTLSLLSILVKAGIAQCDDLSTLQVINSGNQLLFADTECTDAAGWTHYYNSANNRILLSVKKNGQDIGSIDAGMTVRAGTLPGYSTGAFNLSDADYIDNDLWLIANRYWQITGANAITQPVNIRFYFSGTDVFDVANTVDDFGFFVDEPDDLLIFTLSNGNGLDPLSTVTQPSNAVFTLYDMVPGPAPDWVSGEFNGFSYGEFEVATLDIGGGAGFLIFQQGDLLAISGNIAKKSGTPVEDVQVVASISTDTTNANGDYFNGGLLAGANYEVVPFKDTDHDEYLSVADLMALSRHLLSIELFSSPYQYIAADANNDQTITFLDLIQIRNVILGSSPDFPNNTSWRFVPESYVFPDPLNPFTPPFPEQIEITNLQDTLIGQDFIGVKTGDVTEDSAIVPPVLNTTFSLPALSACNPGDTVSFDLQVTDFQNIRAFQFSLGWDEDVMTFLNAKDFTLANFSAANIGSTAAAAGMLSFAWISMSPGGSTVADGTAISKLQFVVNGNINDTTSLEFADEPTEKVLIHQNFSQVTPQSFPGNLTVDNTSAIAVTADLTLPGCEGEPVGGIQLNVTAGTAPFEFLWNNGAVTQHLSGIAGGEYSVTVSDASGSCPKTFFFELPLTSSFNIGGVSFDMTCPYLVNGEIDLEISGGVPPFSYNWSNGSQAQNPTHLYEGAYTVTVTDAAGCTGTAGFTIANPNKIIPQVEVINASFANVANGAVNIIQVSGGTPPFEFLWNTGATAQNLQNILPGDYIVTITDGQGCQHIFGYEVYGLFTAVSETAGNLTSVSLFPNPAFSGRQGGLLLETVTGGEVTTVFYTTEGKMVSREVFQVFPGKAIHRFQMPVQSGLYFIEVLMDGQPAGWLKQVVY